jgi:branched-chain amino acid transport system substrate-binding protein
MFGTLARIARGCGATFVALALGIVPLAGSAADPFEINVIVPLTGAGAFLGKEEAESLSLVERNVNAVGGVRGRPIKFIVADDESNPQVAVQLTNRLLAKNVPIILGGTLLASCLAMAPLVKNGPVLYCLSPGIDPQPGSNIFSTFLLTIDLLRPSIKYLRAKGVRRIAVLTPTDATGQDADHAIDTIVRGSEYPGVSIVGTEHFNVSDISVTAQMSRIKASGAQAIIAWTTGTGFGTVLHGATDVGLDIPIVTSTGNLIYAQMKAYSAFTPQNVLFPGDPAVAPGSQTDRDVARAVRTFAELLKTINAQPDQGHALPYDAAMLIVAAFGKLGLDATPEQLRLQLASTRNYPGIFGRYDFRVAPQRGLTRDTIVVVRWDPARDGWTAVSKPGGAP